MTGGTDRFESNDFNVGTLAAVYMFGGLAAGIVLGALRPALQERSSATLVSILAAAPVSIGMTVFTTGKIGGWTATEWYTAVFGSVLIGLLGMAVLWKDRDLL